MASLATTDRRVLHIHPRTQRQLKRLAVTSVDQLITAIMTYIQNRNRSPKPFVWTASVQHILDKVAKAKETLGALH